jgi:lambda family phage portal protein
MMNPLERIIAAISPEWAQRRAIASAYLRAYEAAGTSRLRTIARSKTTVDADVGKAGLTLRESARWYEQNYDLIDGALDVLVRNVVGTGITPEPLVRLVTGELDTAVNAQLSELWSRWSIAPEVTGEYDSAAAQRIKARTLFRDGEVFCQYLPGKIAGLTHLSPVPFSFELIDPEAVPIDYSVPKQGIVQGVQKDLWNRAVAYAVARTDPLTGKIAPGYQLKPASTMQHLKMAKRLNQTRGITLFASVFERIEDVRDYDESERVAAKIAAKMAAYIKRGNPDLYMPTDANRREHQFQAGMIFDFLEAGEDIGTIDTNRPNPNLGRYRDDQLRAASAGIGLAFSSFARNYEGNYSSRRQEANEAAPHYAVLWDYFVAKGERPLWKQFVITLITERLLITTPQTDINSLYNVDFSRPATPAIDRQKEVGADLNALESFQDTLVDVWRRNGRNPADMWRKLADQAVKLTTIQGANPSSATAITPDPTDNETETP